MARAKRLVRSAEKTVALIELANLSDEAFAASACPRCAEVACICDAAEHAATKAERDEWDAIAAAEVAR